MQNPLEKKLANSLMAPITPGPQSKAIARRLGLDTPEGRTAFISQFHVSYPANISERTMPLEPLVKHELISRLAGDRTHGPG